MPQEIKRELYLKQIRPFYTSEFIKVISGVRRSGKSILLKQIIAEITDNGVPADHIIAINFEDYDYRELKNPDVFNRYIEEKLTGKEKHYLFFDEIQNVKDFQLVINSFRSKHDVSIFITGSNAKLLSGDYESDLGGRTISFRVMTFTFKEYLELMHEQKNPAQHLREYLTWGGFPTVFTLKQTSAKEHALEGLYNSIVLRDIVISNNISSAHALEKVVEYLISSSSKTLSGKNIVSALKNEGVNISLPTVYDLVSSIVKSCIVSKVERYDVNGKKKLSFEEKVFACDPGFIHLKKTKLADENSLIVETVVYNELIARGYQVSIGKTQNHEVDFIAEKGDEKAYIQAAYLLGSVDTIEREFRPLQEIKDNYPKYVISMDEITNNREGIKHLNLVDFLMRQEEKL